MWYSFRDLTSALTRRQPPDSLSLDDLTTFTLTYVIILTYISEFPMELNNIQEAVEGCFIK